MDGTLLQRRHQYKLCFIYNVNTGMVPSYTQDLINPLVSEVSDYPLRSTRNITVPYNRTSISQKIVFHHPLDYTTLLQMI